MFHKPKQHRSTTGYGRGGQLVNRFIGPRKHWGKIFNPEIC